jgi:rubrerythrin
VAVASGHVGADGLQGGHGRAPEESRRQANGPGKALKARAHRRYYTSGQTEEVLVAADAPVYTCWVCGARMREIKCKIVCPHCGYTRDCSDP